MKRISPFVLISILCAGTILFPSCTKDPEEATIVGKWSSESTAITVYDHSVLTFDTSYSMNPDEIIIIFNADKTFIGEPKGGPKETGTYNIDGKNIQFNSAGEIDSFTYTLSKDEFKLTYTAADETDATNKTIETITYKRK